MNQILGVKIVNLSQKEIFSKLEEFLNEEKFHQITTVNPEFILEAQKNEKFREILNNSSLNVADGFGIRLAFLLKGKWLKSRLTGVRLMLNLLEIANQKGYGIFLACRQDGLSSFQEIKEIISKNYPKLKIEGEEFDVIKVTSYKLQVTSDILFCNFGAPYQEIFINSLKDARIRLAVGVGGSFDYLTGKLRRAPKFMRKMGLEWLWRLFREPKYRWRRVLRAVIVFPLKVVFKK